MQTHTLHRVAVDWPQCPLCA